MIETIIKEVETDDEYYTISTDSGTFSLLRSYGAEPKEGDSIIIHTVNGSKVRGVDINGKRIFYKTDEDLESERKKWLDKEKERKEKEFEKNKEKMDKEFKNLPLCFQLRIRRFRRGNERFRIEFEPYELFVCNEAVKIAKHCETTAKVQEFGKLKPEEQFKVASREHSGNTFGITMSLAYWYLKNPEFVVKLHGALTPLVGCEEYGCIHDFEELQYLVSRRLLTEKFKI